MLQRSLLLLILFTILTYNVKSEEAFYPEASFFTEDTVFFFHAIERGQTVYSIAAMYDVSVDAIHKLNPTSKDGIQEGKLLRIPQESGSFLFHTIRPKETLYSVSQKYQMRGENIIEVNPGLSVETFTIGKVIRIPTNKVTEPTTDDNESATEALLNTIVEAKSIKNVKVALLLPIGLKENTTVENASKNRMVEYYEGILLALDDLKKRGVSVSLQVYDIGSKLDIISSVLRKEEMQDIHLLIGGLTDGQINLMSTFASNQGIPYVIPFTSKVEAVLSNHNVIQINTPQSHVHSKTSLAFHNKYKASNIIFFDAAKNADKLELIGVIKADLDAKGVYYKTVSTLTDVASILSEDTNTVFVPTDDSVETLTKLIAALKNAKERNPQLSISLFGHPSWQVYTAKYSADFFRLNASFYSIFYADPTSSAVKSFHNKYNRWYSRELINRFPKYGMLGYDTGMFFIQLLNQYGTSYSANINNLKYKGVQTDFHFERVNNWGGFINTNTYFVEFGADYRINVKPVN